MKICWKVNVSSMAMGNFHSIWNAYLSMFIFSSILNLRHRIHVIHVIKFKVIRFNYYFEYRHRNYNVYGCDLLHKVHSLFPNINFRNTSTSWLNWETMFTQFTCFIYCDILFVHVIDIVILLIIFLNIKILFSAFIVYFKAHLYTIEFVVQYLIVILVCTIT